MWNNHYVKPRAPDTTASRLAEKRIEDRLITPPEELPSWSWFDPKRKRNLNSITRTFCGDPAPGRSAADGWTQKGTIMAGEDGFVHTKQRVAHEPPSKPKPLIKSPVGEAMTALKPRGCKYPIGDPKEVGFKFCNKRRAVGKAYCAEHAEKCEWQGTVPPWGLRG